MQKQVVLSKWWKTKSCRDAFRRVARERKQRMAKLRARMAAKRKERAKLAAE